jgi:hypothetical protein
MNLRSVFWSVLVLVCMKTSIVAQYTGCIMNCATAEETDAYRVSNTSCTAPPYNPNQTDSTSGTYSVTVHFLDSRYRWDTDAIDSPQSANSTASGICIVPDFCEGDGCENWPPPDEKDCDPYWSSEPTISGPICVDQGQISAEYLVWPGITRIEQDGLMSCSLGNSTVAVYMTWAPAECAPCAEYNYCCYSEYGGIPPDYCTYYGDGCPASMHPYEGCCVH